MAGEKEKERKRKNYTHTYENVRKKKKRERERENVLKQASRSGMGTTHVKKIAKSTTEFGQFGRQSVGVTKRDKGEKSL